jgi:hypothetical protein
MATICPAVLPDASTISGKPRRRGRSKSRVNSLEGIVAAILAESPHPRRAGAGLFSFAVLLRLKGFGR